MNLASRVVEGTRVTARMAARVLAAVVLVAAASWLLSEAAPGSAAERAARAAGVLPADDSAVPARLRAEILAQVARQHDLEEPLPARLAGRVAALLRGDLGRSWRDGTAVTTRLANAAGPTALLIALALLAALLAGLGTAWSTARKPGGALDTALAALAAAVFALPPVWLAMLGLRALADGHPFAIVPAGGLDSAAALILPVACLALVPAFVIARHARAALVHAEHAPWAVAARARGLSRQRVLVVHASRVAVTELAPLLAVLVAYLVGASMVLEQVFGIAGLGALLVDASARGDTPVIVGVAVCAGAAVALSSAAADLVQRAADPRLGRAADTQPRPGARVAHR
jgi:peptide/nickel transport system permease protein